MRAALLTEREVATTVRLSSFWVGTNVMNSIMASYTYLFHLMVYPEMKRKCRILQELLNSTRRNMQMSFHEFAAKHFYK